MELLHRVVGPIADERLRPGGRALAEAIAIDTAIPSLRWIADELAERDWTLKLIVSTPRPLGPHRRQRRGRRSTPARRSPSTRSTASGSTNPQPLWAPFEIPPSVPAVELAEGGEIRFGEIRLDVLHTPGHTEGSVCLLVAGRRPAVQRRHAVRRRLGPGRPARGHPGADGRVARPAGRPRGPAPRPARARRGDDDRARAGLAGAGPPAGPAARLMRALAEAASPARQRLAVRRAAGPSTAKPERLVEAAGRRWGSPNRRRASRPPSRSPAAGAARRR